MYEVRGSLKMIGDVQTYPSGFSKREFVVTTAHDKYPQDLKFEIVKDKCPLLDAYETGQEVVVNFDIRGNEYNGKYYVNLSCWKIQPASGAGASPSASADSSSASAAEPSPADLRNEEDFDDDQIPF